MTGPTSHRGTHWFSALTSPARLAPDLPPSVLSADAVLGDETASFFCVIPDENARFPRAREGEVGLDEAYAMAAAIRRIIASDIDKRKRPIVSIVDAKSQAYGRREEIAAIYLAAAAAVDAYASARLAGHPVIALIVGNAISGGFLAHGLQANKILALDDDRVSIHAMHREAAARVMRISVQDIDRLGQTVTPLSYRAREYSRLGLLHSLIAVSSAESPSAEDPRRVKRELEAAVVQARSEGDRLGVSNRLTSTGMDTAAAAARQAILNEWTDL